jgi:hypothetical protein
MLTTQEVLSLDGDQLWSICDHNIRTQFGAFIREFNKREWSVRIGKTHETFEDYARTGYIHQEQFGTGLSLTVDPFRTSTPIVPSTTKLSGLITTSTTSLKSHSKISSLTPQSLSFTVRLGTLSIITGQADDLPYLVRTELPYIDFERIQSDEEYEYNLMRNIELASYHKEQLWGTTELRTSLQIASRNHAALILLLLIVGVYVLMVKI